MVELSHRNSILFLWRWLCLETWWALSPSVVNAAVLRTEPTQSPVVVAEYAHEPKTGWFLAPSSAPPAPLGVDTESTAEKPCDESNSESSSESSSELSSESSSESPLRNETVAASKLWTPPPVLLVVRVRHVDYHALFQRPALLFQFQRVIKEEITRQGDDDEAPSIELALSPGSVIVQAFISPATRPEPSSSNKLDWVTKVCNGTSLVPNIVGAVSTLGEIGEVSKGKDAIAADREACGVASNIGLLPLTEASQTETEASDPAPTPPTVLANSTTEASQCRSLAPQNDCWNVPVSECASHYDTVNGGRICELDASTGNCDGFYDGFSEDVKCEAATTTTSTVVRWDDLDPKVQRALIAFTNSTDRHIAEASASIAAATQREHAGEVKEAFDALPQALETQRTELADFQKNTDMRLKTVRDALRFARVAAEKRSKTAATDAATVVSNTFEQEFLTLTNTGGMLEEQARQLDSRAASAAGINARNAQRAIVARASAAKLAADADSVVMNSTATSLLVRMNTSGQDAVSEAGLVVQQAEATMNLVMKTALIASNASDIALKAVQQATQNALKLQTIKKLVEKVTSAASATTNAAAAR